MTVYHNEQESLRDQIRGNNLAIKHFTKQLEEVFENSQYFTINKRYGEVDNNYEIELTHNDSKTSIVIGSI